MSENPNPSLVARQIKRMFREAKSEQIKKRYSPAAKHNKEELWLAAAENCIQMEGDPYSFVRAAFLFNAVPGGPYSTQLTGAAARRWYTQYRELHRREGKSESTVFENEVADLIRHGLLQMTDQKMCSPREYLLRDTTRLDVIPAYVRIILMPYDAEVRTKWRTEACLELHSNPMLLETMRKRKFDLGFLTEKET